MDTRAMSKAKIENHMKESSGSDQNGMHLLGSIPGDDDELYDQQEEAMRRDGKTEEEKKSSSSRNFEEGREKSKGEDKFMTPLQGFEMGKTTSPAHDGMNRSIEGAGAVTKDFVIKGREAMMEEMMRLEMEMQHYEILLKRAKLKAMQIELEKLSPQNNFLNGISDKRGGDGRVDQVRRRDMLKITVPEFKRGDADEVLNSATNFNTVLRA